MADFGITEVLSVLGTVMKVGGQLSAADSAKQQGERQRQADAFQAAQLEQQAGQETAAAQRAAIDQRRQASLVASRAIAAAGASGGGVSDASVNNLIADIQGEGSLRAATKIYQGEDSARQLRMGASAKTFEGDLAVENANARATGYRTGALASGFTGGATLYGKYGMGGPKSALTGNGWQDAGTPDSAAWS